MVLSLVKAFRDSSPKPAPEIFVTGAIQPFNSLMALLAGWNRIKFLFLTSSSSKCHLNFLLNRFLIKYFPSGIQETFVSLFFQGSSIVLQITLPSHSSLPLVPSGKYFRVSKRTITHHCQPY